MVGQTGVELAYESVLQGVRGEQVVYIDALGDVVGLSTSIEPAERLGPSCSTLDVDIQRTAEESLERIVGEMRKRGIDSVGGSAIVMDCTQRGDPRHGEQPDPFSPSVFVGGISHRRLGRPSGRGRAQPPCSPAPSRVSTRPARSSSRSPRSPALDHGIATPDSSYYCTGWWTWSGDQSDPNGMKCWSESGHGGIGLVGGITYSCDVVFYEIGKGFWSSDDPEGMQETFREYGLGSTTGIDISGEAAGRVPDAAWKWDYFKSLGYSDDDATWQGGENCNLAIGQGDMLVTCLQMACVYCGLANGGPIWRPHVMHGVRARIGDGFISRYRAEQINDVQEDPTYRDLVKQGMLGVTYEESPSQTAHWTNLDVRVCSKTGTAEQTSADRNVGWFGAYAPADDPKYVAFANVDGADWGSSSAMLVVRDIFGTIYGQPDTSTAEVGGTD